MVRRCIAGRLRLVSLKAGEWAAWVQAIGSILTIAAGFGTIIFQNRHADRVQEAERARRAEVVAYRLSGWCTEAHYKIEIALRSCKDARAAFGPNIVPGTLIPALKLDMAANIHDVLPDLHYLRAGSADIAELDHLIRTYEAGLLRWINTSELEKLYDPAEWQLGVMSALQQKVARFIDKDIVNGR
jgi:hypothetical protein